MSEPDAPARPLNLIKLAVGAESIAGLERFVAWSVKHRGALVHVTRSMPKRGTEIIVSDVAQNGSLYWVIKGHLACRQRLTALTPIRDADGITRCAIALDPVVIAVEPRPVRPFQGWRYLEAADAPRDLGASGPDAPATLPEALRRELASLGLL